MKQNFTATPNPVAQNGTTMICYDFAHSGATSPVTVKLVWPGVGAVTFVLTAEEPCTVVAVPPNATGGTLVDQSGQSEDGNITVTP